MDQGMNKDSIGFMCFLGAGGGGERELLEFAAGLGYPIHFDIIRYPGWKRYIEADFCAETLMEEFTAEIIRRAPEGPIRLLGISVGGHFAYSVAVRLQQRGREVALFCSIDSFIATSAQPSPGWKGRAISETVELIRKRRFGELPALLRSKVWRTALRLAGGNIPGLLSKVSSQKSLRLLLDMDAVAEKEVSMRLLLAEVTPWVLALDRDPVALTAPAIYLRTRLSATHDAAFRNRCPNIVIREIPGGHLTLFEPENIQGLRDAFTSAVGEFPHALLRPAGKLR